MRRVARKCHFLGGGFGRRGGRIVRKEGELVEESLDVKAEGVGFRVVSDHAR